MLKWPNTNEKLTEELRRWSLRQTKTSLSQQARRSSSCFLFSIISTDHYYSLY